MRQDRVAPGTDRRLHAPVVYAVVGCDLGTQSTKASVFALDGRPLGHASMPVEVVRPRPGWAEQDPRVLEESACAAIRQALAAAPEETRALGLAFSGQMGGAIGLDARGATITPYESWMDTRADGDRAESLAAAGPAVLEANGIIPFVGPRVRRWRREQPALAARLARVVAPAGYVAARLTGAGQGEATCDRTQVNLFGCFDARRGTWDPALAGAIGLPPELLPRLVDPTDVIGWLAPDAAARCGLPAGLPVAGGIGDGTAGWLAAGAARLDEPSWYAPEAVVETVVEPAPERLPAYAHLSATYRGLKPLLAPFFEHIARRSL